MNMIVIQSLKTWIAPPGDMLLINYDPVMFLISFLRTDVLLISCEGINYSTYDTLSV